jgi:hypothetical protein
LEKVTREAKHDLSQYEICDPIKYRREALGALKKHLLLLSTLVPRFIETQREYLQLVERNSDKAGLSFDAKLIDLADSTVLKAEIVSAELEAKWCYFDEVTSTIQTLPTESDGSSPSNVITPETQLIGINAEADVRDNVSLVVLESGTENEPNLSKLDDKVELKDTDNIAVPPKVSKWKTEITDSRKKFELKAVSGFTSSREFALFWKEFHRTVGRSPIEVEYKFAALLSLVQGEPSQLFTNLDCKREEDYQTALDRLLDKYASDELKQEEREQASSAKLLLSANVENVAEAPLEEWSDAYFIEKYCKAVPSYREPPSCNLLVRAIKAFLDLYTLGPDNEQTKNIDYKSVWLLLLYGWHRYCEDLPSCFGAKNFQFLNEFENHMGPEQIVVPYFLNRKKYPDIEPVSWLFCDENGKGRNITKQELSSWYVFWFHFVDSKSNDSTMFPKIAKYFTFLSFSLFGASMKQPESVEKFITLSFDATFNSCIKFPEQIYFNSMTTIRLPDIVPPHAGVYSFIKILFKRNSVNFRTYLTYLFGFYQSQNEFPFRHFVDVSVLEFHERTNAGLIYWLQRAAKNIRETPRALLKFLLVDPSLEAHVKKIENFLNAHNNQISWRWARLSEKEKFEELTISSCPAFAYACFVLDPLNKVVVERYKKYPNEFSGFVNDVNGLPSLTGENLGRLVRRMIMYPDDGEYWECSDEESN